MESLQKHYAKSVITSAVGTNADVFSLITDSNEAFGNFMRVRSGSIIQSLNLGFKMNIEEEQEAVLSEFIAEIESKFGKISGEVIVPFLPDVEMDGVAFRIPVKGDKMALLELSTKNAKEFQFNSIRQKEHTDPDQYRNMVLEDLKRFSEWMCCLFTWSVSTTPISRVLIRWLPAWCSVMAFRPRKIIASSRLRPL